MSVATVRRIVAGFFLLNTVAVVWPVLVPFNRVRPLVFGLPFSMVWLAGWLVATVVVLGWLNHVEKTKRD